MGSDIIDSVSLGAHFCMFYQTKDDLIDVLVPYFKAGLENNELCVWVTAKPLKARAAEASLRRAVGDLDNYIRQGQIEILDADQWYTQSGEFESDRVLQQWIEKEGQAIKEGFTGLRVTGNTSWLDKRNWEEFVDYEARINEIIRDYRMIVLCSYSLDGCEVPEVIDTVSNHQFALIRREGVWESIESFEREQIKERLQSLHEITERTEEVIEAQRSESVDILAARIAHDFNNNLTAILGNVSLARIYDDPDKSLEKLIAAEREIMQAKELARQLLIFSKDDEPTREIAHIGELLEDSATFASRGSNVKCEFSIPYDLWPVEIDEGQIRQVVGNMIINADQAMPEGGIIMLRAENVTIGTENALSLKDGEYVDISIEDQGIGIPEKDLQSIFRLYFTTKQRGSGLGLASSHIIIERHGGYIKVESQIGIGTTFHIYLPAHPGKAPVGKPQMERRLIAGTGRILIMDDEKYIRDLASEMLNAIGYEVTTAIDGAEAIEAYQEARNSGQPYDALVVDLTVPGGMGGKETIQKLRVIDPEARVIISSGYSTVPIMTDFEKYGFKGAIAKPYEAAEFSMVLHEVIAGKKSA
ncbi:MEDS domain-containing protein [Candidatus Poribacteria bacterium]